MFIKVFWQSHIMFPEGFDLLLQLHSFIPHCWKTVSVHVCFLLWLTLRPWSVCASPTPGLWHSRRSTSWSFWRSWSHLHHKRRSGRWLWAGRTRTPFAKIAQRCYPMWRGKHKKHNFTLCLSDRGNMMMMMMITKKTHVQEVRRLQF